MTHRETTEKIFVTSLESLEHLPENFIQFTNANASKLREFINKCNMIFSVTKIALDSSVPTREQSEQLTCLISDNH